GLADGVERLAETPLGRALVLARIRRFDASNSVTGVLPEGADLGILAPRTVLAVLAFEVGLRERRVSLRLDVRCRLVDDAHVSGERRFRFLPIFLFGVVRTDGESDRCGLGRLRRAVVLGERLRVFDGLFLLTKADAKNDRVCKRAIRFFGG